MSFVPVPSGLRFNELGHWTLRTLTPTSGPGLDGRQQYITRETRVWVNRYQVRGAWGADQGRYLAFLDQCRGMANPFDLPVSNFCAANAPSGSALFVMEDGNFLFADGTSNIIALDDQPNPTVAADAPVAAEAMQLAGYDGAYLPVGAMFSVNAFLYRVAANDAGAITFSPPLRQAIAAGVILQVAAPTVRVRLASDDAAATAHRFDRRRGPYTIDVIEAFER